MKVPLRGRGGKQDRPEESKKAFHLSVINIFLQSEGQRSHSHTHAHSDHRDQLSLVIKRNEQGVLLMSRK